jgi:glycerol-3-phosphate dehydrogenase
VEARDFAKGTSSRATKLVHGGVRYLAQGNVSLVREALRERMAFAQ